MRPVTAFGQAAGSAWGHAATTALGHAASTAFGYPVPPAPPYRVVVPGTELRMLVLAAEPGGYVGVDMDTGAFVRARLPAGQHPPDFRPGPFDVVSAEIAGVVDPFDGARPEALELAEAPKPAGHLPPRRAERLLSRLHHPPRLPLLGMVGNAVPYWTLVGDQPSLALVEIRTDPRVRWGPFGPLCHFSWQDTVHQLPLADRTLINALKADGLPRPSKADVQRLLGYRPRRLLVMFTAPRDGYCHKVVAALLPTGR